MIHNANRYAKTNGLKKEIQVSENLTHRFVVVTKDHSIIEAYNRMLSNKNSDLELKKII